METAVTNEEIAALVHELQEGNPSVRGEAAWALAVMGSGHPAVLPALIAALGDEDLAVRLAVAQALQDLGAPAVPALVEALAEAPAQQRQAIVNTLGLFGPLAHAAVPHLNVLRTAAETGQEAARALEAIQDRKRDWKRALEKIAPWVLSAGILCAGVFEVVSWIDFFARTQGPALHVAVAWGILGAYFGAVAGTRLNRSIGLKLGMNYLGVAGCCAGAFVGQLASDALEPIVRVLGVR